MEALSNIIRGAFSLLCDEEKWRTNLILGNVRKFSEVGDRQERGVATLSSSSRDDSCYRRIEAPALIQLLRKKKLEYGISRTIRFGSTYFPIR